MKVIIAGSRSITSYDKLVKTIEQSGFDITEIVSGGARGVDTLGEHYAHNNNIPLTIIKAEWDKYGRSAGYKRNVQMADYADALIALWDGESRGTRHMITIAKVRDLKTFITKL
jgi:hypothetical protein